MLPVTAGKHQKISLPYKGSGLKTARILPIYTAAGRRWSRGTKRAGRICWRAVLILRVALGVERRAVEIASRQGPRRAAGVPQARSESAAIQIVT